MSTRLNWRNILTTTLHVSSSDKSKSENISAINFERTFVVHQNNSPMKLKSCNLYVSADGIASLTNLFVCS